MKRLIIERGNKIVDGLLIEYFANPPRQIRKYFEDDYNNIRPISQTQFITGKILLDKTGEVQKLKEEAKEMLDKHYKDLKDSFENNREDFDFIYYCNLDKLLSLYMKQIEFSYNKKTILGNITNKIVSNKYLLDILPDNNINELIKNCILTIKKEHLNNYELLTKKIFDLTSGFDIDQFEFKSQIDC